MKGSIISKALFYRRLHVITGIVFVISFFLLLHAMLTFDLNGIIYSLPPTFGLAIVNWFFLCKFSRTSDQIKINLGDDSEEHF